MKKCSIKAKKRFVSLIQHLIEYRIPLHVDCFCQINDGPDLWLFNSIPLRIIINMGNPAQLLLSTKNGISEYELDRMHAIFMDSYCIDKIINFDSLLTISIYQSCLNLQHTTPKNKTELLIDLNYISHIDQKTVIELFENILDANNRKNLAGEYALSQISILLIEISKMLELYNLMNIPDKSFIKASSILDYLSRNYRNPSTTRETASATLQISLSHIKRLLKQYTGLGFKEHLLLNRLEYSRTLLMDTDKQIPLIAKASGFNSHSHFTYSFNNRYNITPLKFRKMILSDQARTSEYLRTVHYTKGLTFAKQYPPEKLNEAIVTPKNPQSIANTILFCNTTEEYLLVNKITPAGETDMVLEMQPFKRYLYTGPNYCYFLITDISGKHKAVFFLKARNIIALYT